MQSSTIGSTPSTGTHQGLQRLLTDADTPPFLNEYFGERMLFVKGNASQWADLFSWHDLNVLLGQGFIHHPRVRLVRNGADVDPALYTFESGGGRRIDAFACQRLLAEGASLILIRIENANPRLATFIRQLERDLNADVHVDVIATCAAVPALKIHWDNTECFNLQLDGEKTWQVVSPERLYPLTANERFPQRQDVVKPTPPAGEPVWNGIMSPGDLIYLPRGWWHTVSPRTVPSLHLSVAVDVPTLSDFLLWFARQSTHHETARRNLPMWLRGVERRERVAGALGELAGMLSPETVERFLADFRATSAIRPAFALPGAGTSQGVSLRGETIVRLRSTQPLEWTLSGGWVTFEWQGHPHQFDAQLVPMLRTLERVDVCRVDELSKETNRLITFAFLQALIAAGVVEVMDSDALSF